jgi:outer membrane protein assembly factor BamB
VAGSQLDFQASEFSRLTSGGCHASHKTVPYTCSLAAALINGNLIAYDPATGRILWHFRTGAMVSNGPMTYQLDGKQYLVVGAGDTLFAFSLLITTGDPR